MATPSNSKTAAPAAAQRPSLLGGNPSAQRPHQARGGEPSDFGVSILGAMSDAPRTRSKRSSVSPAAPKRAWLWWVGTALVAVALVGAAQWQRSQAQASQAAAPLPLAQAPAKPAAVIPAPATQAALPAPLSAASAASAVATTAPALAADATPTPEAVAAGTGAALATLAMAKPDPTPPASTKPTTRPVTAAATERKATPPRASTPRPATAVAAKPAAPKVAAALASTGRDADAELLAALMAHSDASKDGGKAKAAAPLSEAERRRFAATLRGCRQGSASAQASCRQSACQGANYWGRTKSCPANGISGSPSITAAS
jgi:hypothetical protein